MNVEFPALALPPQTELKIELSITASINVTAQTAQRKVSKLLLDELGNLLYGEIPSLVAGQQLLWRVPVWYATPATGPVAQVGTLDVNATTGEILFTLDLLQEIADHAHALAQRTPSPTR